VNENNRWLGHDDLLVVNLESAGAGKTPRSIVAQATIDLHDASRHAVSCRLIRRRQSAPYGSAADVPRTSNRVPFDGGAERDALAGKA
jgi:hypothetical protein